MASGWPAFDVDRDSPTFATLHLASQMLGKMRVANAAWVNHGWHATLRPVARASLPCRPFARAGGVSRWRSTSAPMPSCSRSATERATRCRSIDGQSIADLHAGFIAMLDRHDLPSQFDGRPNEIADAVRFADDQAPRRYNRRSAETLRDALARHRPGVRDVSRRLPGQGQPGPFLLGQLRPRRDPLFGPPGARRIPAACPACPTGSRAKPTAMKCRARASGRAASIAAEPIFYSYAYPEPERFPRCIDSAGRRRSSTPRSASSACPMRPFATSADPERELMGFLQSTYEAAADLAKWDRLALEREPVAP